MLMRRILGFLLLSLFFLFVAQPTFVFAAGSTIENGDFESESFMWNTGALTIDAPAVGLRCLSFSAPISAGADRFSHTISYVPGLSLSGQTVYTFSCYVRASVPLLSTDTPSTSFLFDEEKKAMTFCIQGVSENWSKISFPFLLEKAGVYSISILIEGLGENSKVYLDDVRLAKLEFDPQTISVTGPRMATIPAQGTIAYKYAPVAVDKNGACMNVQNAILRANNLPQGVSFDADSNSLYVESTATAGDSVLLECTVGTPTFSQKIRIDLSDNMVRNGSFSDFPLYENWENANSAFSIQTADTDRYARLSMLQTAEAAYEGTLRPMQSFVLHANTLYVFRGRFCTDSGWSVGPIQTSASISAENTIDISVSNIGSTHWTEAIAAFCVPADGIYSLNIHLFAEDARPIFADFISLQTEAPSPSRIYFDAPPQIAIPNEGETGLSLSPFVYNQEGVLCNTAVNISVFPQGQGVSVRENQLVVSANTVPQTYTICASLKTQADVVFERSLFVCSAILGDGSFEDTQPGALWTTAQPSLLHFSYNYQHSYPTDGEKMARLTMNGAVSVLLSKSVFQYQKASSYVFEADIKTFVPDIPTVVTVLIENTNSASFDDNLVVGQFTISKNLQHIETLFTPSMTVTGQLMIAFNTPETHNQQQILLDAVSVKKASVEATNVTISGTADVDKNITGKYRFNANFETVDASTYRWLISDSASGIFIPLEGQTRSTLSITEDMLWKYLKLEVTPVSLNGPVVGPSAFSSVIRVGAPIPATPVESTPLPPVSVPEAPPFAEEAIKPTILRGSLQVLDLDKFSSAKKDVFLDLRNHWAKSEIELLSAAGVIEGRGNGLFEPDAQITRAEFSAFLARAFELAPIFYENQFQDIKPYHWYAGAIAVVVKHEIAKGTSETTFSPELPITREEMAAMIMRAYRKTNAQVKESNLAFIDANTISAWAKQDVAESTALAFLSGFPNGRFLPKQNATRAEAAVVIKRMLSYVAQIT